METAKPVIRQELDYADYYEWGVGFEEIKPIKEYKWILLIITSIANK